MRKSDLHDWHIVLAQEEKFGMLTAWLKVNMPEKWKKRDIKAKDA